MQVDDEYQVAAAATTSLSTQTEEQARVGSTAESMFTSTDSRAFASKGMMTDDAAMDGTVFATRGPPRTKGLSAAEDQAAAATAAQAIARVQLGDTPTSARTVELEISGGVRGVQQPAHDFSSSPSLEQLDAAQFATPGGPGSLSSPGAEPSRSPARHLPPDAASLYMSALANSGYTPFTGTEALSDALAAAQDALEEVQNVIPRLQQQQQRKTQGLDSSGSLVYRGQLRSILVATRTLLQHTALLLSDVEEQATGQGLPLDWQPDASEAGTQVAASRAAALLKLLGNLQLQFDESAADLQAICNNAAINSEPAAYELAGSNEAGAGLSTTQLDAASKAVGQAQFALTQAVHKRGAALAAIFLQGADEGPGQDGPGPSGRGTAASSTSTRSARCFRLGGGLQLKKLRNGDVYRSALGKWGGQAAGSCLCTFYDS